MKKIFTLICAAVLACGFASAQKVLRYDVTNATEFNNALTEIATLEKGSTAYVYIQGLIDAKTLKNDASGKMQPTLRNIHFIGVNDEETGERATLKMEMQLPANNTEADGFSLHYENLRLMQTQGVWGNSKHLMNFKDTLKHYIDTLEFVNCELTELCRSLYRAEAQNKNTDAGTMKVFRMENCVVHNGFRQASAMPAIYMAQPVNEMTFKNNTFYDLTYLNGIVSFGTMTENTGRQAVKVVFENNTVCAWSKASLLGYAGGVSTESEFHIKNNIIVQPNWIDEMNGRFGDTNGSHAGVGIYGETDEANGFLTQDSVDARIAKGVNLTNLDGGLVQLENNILYGYKYQNLNDAIDMGNIIPIGNDENEEAEFSFLTMEDAGFAWSDFVDAKNDKFQINDQHAVHAAGKNGAPLGDTNNYTDKVIKEVAVSIKISGSKTVSYAIEPMQEKYFTGDKITITLNDHNNALRTLNTFKGWSDGSMETIRVIELTDNLDLTATYESAISGVVSWFDFSQTPAAGQNKLTNYEADVYAEGNRAVATMMMCDTLNAAVSGDYRVVNGSENRFNWRSSKFGEDAADQQICVLSRKSPAIVRAENKPDFLVFTFSTKDLHNVVFSAFCGTDNFGYKTQLADYSIDGGQTWINFAKVDMESKPASYAGASEPNGVHWGWTELKGILPAEVENLESVQVRVIGDVTGEQVDNVYSGIDHETANMFEYVGAVLITAGEAAGIQNVNFVQNKNAVRYNLSGQKVDDSYKGVVIVNGKKMFVK